MKNLLVIIFLIISISVFSQEKDIEKMNVKESVEFINSLMKDPVQNKITCDLKGEIEYATELSTMTFNIKQITTIKYNTPFEGWYDALLKCSNDCIKLSYNFENKHRTDNEASFGASSKENALKMVEAFKHLKSLIK